jgi:hypothetical protein
MKHPSTALGLQLFTVVAVILASGARVVRTRGVEPDRAAVSQSPAPEPGFAKGAMVHRDKTIALTHAYLVVGPDVVDPATMVRRVVLATEDVKASLMACDTMMCVGGRLREGMTVDVGVGGRVNYWMVHTSQRVQYSASNPMSTFTPEAEPDDSRVAGALVFDDSAADGPKVDVTFDARLVKKFERHHQR